jgi:hypothetical protein
LGTSELVKCSARLIKSALHGQLVIKFVRCVLPPGSSIDQPKPRRSNAAWMPSTIQTSTSSWQKSRTAYGSRFGFVGEEIQPIVYAGFIQRHLRVGPWWFDAR